MRSPAFSDEIRGVGIEIGGGEGGESTTFANLVALFNVLPTALKGFATAFNGFIRLSTIKPLPRCS